ncbi:MAG: histidine phosphatase family protein [Methylobacter sp.]|nr:histidine phosphatase family protein [Methylobacter sp.]
MDDFSRPLKKRGRRAAKRIGCWLREQHLIPDTILSSPATRALATAQRVCRQLDIDEAAIVCDSRLYEADAQTLLTVLKTSCHERRVLLVGHNPGLEDLLLKLIPDSVPLSANGKCLPTAALAQLAFEGDWTELAEGRAKLVTLIRPDSLPE